MTETYEPRRSFSPCTDNNEILFCSSTKQAQDKDKKEDDLNTRIQVGLFTVSFAK